MSRPARAPGARVGGTVGGRGRGGRVDRAPRIENESEIGRPNFNGLETSASHSKSRLKRLASSRNTGEALQREFAGFGGQKAHHAWNSRSRHRPRGGLRRRIETTRALSRKPSLERPERAQPQPSQGATAGCPGLRELRALGSACRARAGSGGRVSPAPRIGNGSEIRRPNSKELGTSTSHSQSSLEQ